MTYPSKEDNIIKLFLNEATKQWHFHDIVKNAKVSEIIAAKWLKKYCSEKIIRRIKPRTKMPYYIANLDNQKYHSEKKILCIN